MVGEGGFGCVFKGWLDVDNLKAARPGTGVPVAIKKLIPYGSQGHNEWLVSSSLSLFDLIIHVTLVILQ